MIRKGIVMAGGTGTRLHPLTTAVSKQLLPIYNKPMIFYPVSVLMMAGIKDILIIVCPRDVDSYKTLLGSGQRYGVKLSYELQSEPKGVAEAFRIGETFIGGDPVCLILGDNLFYGAGFKPLLEQACQNSDGATIFGYTVGDPWRFGVVELDVDGSIVSISEKPENPRSNIAVTGLYFFDNQAVKLAASVQYSPNGEREISTLLQLYLEQQKLFCKPLGRGFAWLDTGTYESLLEASQFVETIEKRQGSMIACLEEIGLSNGWITNADVIANIEESGSKLYQQYILSLIDGR